MLALINQKNQSNILKIPLKINLKIYVLRKKVTYFHAIKILSASVVVDLFTFTFSILFSYPVEFVTLVISVRTLSTFLNTGIPFSPIGT